MCPAFAGQSLESRLAAQRSVRRAPMKNLCSPSWTRSQFTRRAPLLVLPAFTIACSIGPERSGAIQIPLFFILFFFPLLFIVHNRMKKDHHFPFFGLHLLIYLLYESGISIGSNIRCDLIPIIGSLIASFWFALEGSKEKRA